MELLQNWSQRTDLRERSAEAAFLEEFFHRIWGYVQSGQAGSSGSFSLYPQFPVDGGSASGQRGSADAALGSFNATQGQIPEVLCEFKDIKSSLDAPQRRKGDNRSPVQQGLGYLSAARRGMFGNEPIVPTWAIVTDMNEFRLYWADRGPRQFVRFTIRPADLFQGPSLLDQTEEGRFDRFLFYKLFNRDTLLVRGLSGRCLLAQLVAQQWIRERDLENSFYQEYRVYRESLYISLLESNPEGSSRFPGTKGRLVRMAQKVLDRCIFIFFCEDMGRALNYPPQLLRDFLIHESNDNYFDPDGCTIWPRLVSLFRAMNDGTAFGGQRLNQFNGGLFAHDEALDQLIIPNRVFCQQGQGQNEASLYAHPLTLLYLSASYNYAAGWAEGLSAPPVTEVGGAVARGPERSLGLYTLGRIFEQSITELEILEAEADDRVSVNKEGKRKRDGVYYTPEWVVDRVVTEALGGRLDELKQSAGWPTEGTDRLPDERAILAYEDALRNIKIVDPACGSGAFLITALKYLVDEWHALQELRKQVSRDYTAREGAEQRTIREILRSNLYGVDINPASVELTKLALWLHTAKGDQPLSGLDNHIRDGNSLIGSDFYEGLAPYSDAEQERINAFDWRPAFPEVFERGGFDVVLGNPPYVKLQNFRKAHPDMAGFLKIKGGGEPTYISTQTGNFDLYLPFIEKGIELLNENGRLGYIAPSLWTMNDYGEGLRDYIHTGRHLYGWIDFRSHQVFEEATTYTALQFFTKRPNDVVKIAFAPDGVIPEDPWAGNESSLTYNRLIFGDRWLMTTGADRDLIDQLYGRCRRLDHPHLTSTISQGVKTGADKVFKLILLPDGSYRSQKDGQSVEVEREIVRPIVSGPHTKRYMNLETDEVVIFPYRQDGSRMVAISEREFQENYPLAHRYLQSFRDELLDRDSGELDPSLWYQFSRSQGLSMAQRPKIAAAGTVQHLQMAYDPAGEYLLTGGRVDGIFPSERTDPYFLLGVLNGPVCDYVFRKTARPKANGWFEANKQFIEHLPIPDATQEQQNSIAARAERLQRLHSERRHLLAQVARRMQVVRKRPKPEIWLFPDLITKRDLQAEAPARLETDKKRAWAKAEYNRALQGRYDALGARLRPGVLMTADFENGELTFRIDGVAVIQQIFLPDAEGQFIAAQWKLLAITYSVTENSDGKRLANALRNIGHTDNPALVRQIVGLQQRISDIENSIAIEEGALNAETYTLYGLSRAEIQLVEAG